MPALQVRWLGEVRAEEFLAGEEARFGAGSPIAVAGLFADLSLSVGVRTPVPPELQRRAAELGLPIHRRRTGGSGLLHRPGDLVWSVLLPRDDPRAGREFVRAYGRLGGPLVEALQRAGVPASWGPALGLSDRFCLFGPLGEVLLADGRALGGAAQRASARLLLHHGVVGDRVDRPLLAELFRVGPGLLGERLGAVSELAPTASLAEVGRAMLAIWAGA